jgi:Flp pilus assembly protein TadD
MASRKNKTIALSLLVSILLTACNSSPIKSNNNDDLDNAGNILDMLDPDISTEQQAFAKAQSALQQGKNENALFYFVKTLQFNKNNIQALEQIALIHERGKHPEFAIKVYHDILAIDGKNALANEKLGLYYLNRGQDGKAKQLLSQAVKTDSKKWKSYNGLGVIADLERNSAEAINYYQAALAIEPSNPMLLNNLGYSYYLSGDVTKAKELFKQALNFDTQYKRAIHNLALIEIKNGDFTSAVMLFNRIMSPHETYNNIGYIAMLNGQYDAAEEYLRRAIDESPVYFPKAQENLKNLLAQRPSRTSYQTTPEVNWQSGPAPEVETEGYEGPETNVNPELNAKEITLSEKRTSQRSNPSVNHPDKKTSYKKENKIIQPRQFASQQAKKKTQPEIKRVTNSKATLSDTAKPAAISAGTFSLVPSKPPIASAKDETIPTDQAQKPAQTDHTLTLPNSEESIKKTAQSQTPQPQGTERTPPVVILEQPTASPQQPVTNPNSKESAQPSTLQQEEQGKILEPQPQSTTLSSPAVTIQTTTPEPKHPERPITEDIQPAAKNVQSINTVSPAAKPKSELQLPSSPSTTVSIEKQETEAPQKIETSKPLTSINSVKKTGDSETNITVNK